MMPAGGGAASQIHWTPSRRNGRYDPQELASPADPPCRLGATGGSSGGQTRASWRGSRAEGQGPGLPIRSRTVLGGASACGDRAVVRPQPPDGGRALGRACRRCEGSSCRLSSRLRPGRTGRTCSSGFPKSAARHVPPDRVGVAAPGRPAVHAVIIESVRPDCADPRVTSLTCCATPSAGPTACPSHGDRHRRPPVRTSRTFSTSADSSLRRRSGDDRVH